MGIENRKGNPFRVENPSRLNTGYITTDGITEIFYGNERYLELVLDDVESVRGSNYSSSQGSHGSQRSTDPYENLQ